MFPLFSLYQGVSHEQPFSIAESLAVPLLLAIAIFGPPTAFLTFAHALTQNPVLITLLIVFYEIIVVLASLFGKVWQKLEDPWLEQIASWIRTRVQRLVSHPHKTYCQYMFYQHRDLDVKGLGMQTTFNLALDQVFVEPSMVPTLPDQVSANPLQLPKSLSEGSHPIWDYLSAAAPTPGVCPPSLLVLLFTLQKAACLPGLVGSAHLHKQIIKGIEVVHASRLGLR